MDKSRHVMLQGEGAEKFAIAQNIEIVDPEYFYTKRRYNQMKKKVRANKAKKHSFLDTPETKYGTVGAVAKDGCGNLAAATSTGGLTAKEFGRVGDAPIIGAGTYADNNYCAVSATGTGEFFIRAGVARDICSRREYLGETIAQSAKTDEARKRSNDWMRRRVMGQAVAVGLLLLTVYVQTKSRGA